MTRGSMTGRAGRAMKTVGYLNLSALFEDFGMNKIPGPGSLTSTALSSGLISLFDVQTEANRWNQGMGRGTHVRDHVMSPQRRAGCCCPIITSLFTRATRSRQSSLQIPPQARDPLQSDSMNTFIFRRPLLSQRFGSLTAGVSPATSRSGPQFECNVCCF